MATPIRLDASPEERVRFWSSVKTHRGVLKCWDWRGTPNAAGYGVFTLDGTSIPSHRVAYAFAYGVDPGERMVLHSCDREVCNNPRHLRLGDADGNGADRAVAALMDRLHRTFTSGKASVPAHVVQPRRRARQTISPEAAWRSLRLTNETALAIRFSFWALGVRDINALAAAHGAKPTSVYGVLRRDRNRNVPRVTKEPKPRGSCGHHYLSEDGFGIRAGLTRRHISTVAIPSLDVSASRCTNAAQQGAAMEASS